MREAMKELFGLIKRPWGVYYIKNKTTGEQTSLKTKDKAEAQRLLQARNDSDSQPHFNLCHQCDASPGERDLAHCGYEIAAIGFRITLAIASAVDQHIARDS